MLLSDYVWVGLTEAGVRHLAQHGPFGSLTTPEGYTRFELSSLARFVARGETGLIEGDTVYLKDPSAKPKQAVGAFVRDGRAVDTEGRWYRVVHEREADGRIVAISDDYEELLWVFDRSGADRLTGGRKLRPLVQLEEGGVYEVRSEEDGIVRRWVVLERHVGDKWYCYNPGHGTSMMYTADYLLGMFDKQVGNYKS